MQKWTEGQYRTDATENRPASAYVIDGRVARFVTEAEYRRKQYKPAYEALPSEDEYDAR